MQDDSKDALRAGHCRFGQLRSGIARRIVPAMTRALREHESRELTVDRWVHWVGLAAAPAAAVVLLWDARQTRPQILAGLIAYCIGLLAVIGCSALYHLARASRRRGLFRRFDHAAIFLLIAGTYTPFTLEGMLGAEGPMLLACIWGLALVGIGLKLVSPPVLERISIAIYLLMGWSGVTVLDALLADASRSVLVLLAAGGMFYTTGVVFHVWERLRFQNAIWHVFVLLGAACHYAAIFHEVG